MLPERGNQRRAPLHGAQLPSRRLGELSQIVGAEIRERVLLQVTPDVLDRVQFRRICRKSLELDGALQGVDEGAYRARAMRGQTIPDDKELAPNRLMQRREKLDQRGALDRAGEEAEVEPIKGDAGYRRELMPVEVVLQHGGFTLRRPGANAGGALGEARLVDEDDHAALFCGVFLEPASVSSSSGQSPARRARWRANRAAGGKA